MSFLQPYLAAAVLPLGFEIGLAVWKKHRGVPVSVWRAVGLFVCGLYVTEVLLLTGIPVLQDFLLGIPSPSLPIYRLPTIIYGFSMRFR